MTSVTVVVDKSGKPTQQSGRWFNTVGQYLNSLLGPLGFGNGGTVTMQTKAIGTGGGPTNPQQPVTYRQISVNGVVYWIPLFQ
ncbi:MAG: hypothetical protein KGI06_05905 [Candidatus Micrarchaeota archaeon]|nr:hypothetical protein [Candidatus Micrarchaeota archaeon]